jgi:hypothetical protein
MLRYDVCMQVTLTVPSLLVPPHLASRDPEYYVFSGLVFTAVSEPYLASEYGADFMSLAPVALLDKVSHLRGEECVLYVYCIYLYFR